MYRSQSASKDSSAKFANSHNNNSNRINHKIKRQKESRDVSAEIFVKTQRFYSKD